MRIKTLVWTTAVLWGLTGSTAVAAPVLYDIHFTATQGPAPTSGSFRYDSAGASFSDFFVVWEGLLFDLTSAANAAASGGACNTPGNSAADAFAFLSDPTCGTGGGANKGWTGASVPSDDFFSFSHQDAVPLVSSFIAFGVSNGPGLATRVGGQGDFSISAAPVPEPGTVTLLAMGAAAVAWAGRRRRARA